MDNMTPLKPAIRIALKDDWAIVASEAGRYTDGLKATIALWRNSTMVPPVETFPLGNGTTRQAFAALVANRIRGYAQDTVEAKLLELFTAIEGRSRATGTARVSGPAAADAHESALPWSDYTNARAFVQDHGQHVRYIYPWKSWLVWTGTHWERDVSGTVMHEAKTTIKRLARQIEAIVDDADAQTLMRHIKASLATVKLKAMVESAQSEPGISVQPDALDADPWLLNCQNGTLDLHTATLRPHQPDDLITRCLPLAYDPAAPCPTWERFLWRIMGGTTPEDDTEAIPADEGEKRHGADERATRLIAFLQRAIGYSLTGETSEQCLFLLHGTGANGKSTCLEALQGLLGDYAQSTPSATLLAKDRHDGIPNDIARLRGARLVTAVEIGEGKRLNEELVKRLTGQDTLTARFLFAEFFDFQAQFKLFLACNHLPQIRGTDHAIWRRIKLIPFTVTIPAAEQDKSLPAKLREELPGILAWAVRGCQTWQREGLSAPKEVSAATADYKAEQDVLSAFIHECCVTLDSARVSATKLYGTFVKWGEVPLTQRQFGKLLTERGYKRYKNNGVWYEGIGLNASEEDSRTEHTERTEPAEPKIPLRDNLSVPQVPMVPLTTPKQGHHPTAMRDSASRNHSSVASVASVAGEPTPCLHTWLKVGNSRKCAICNTWLDAEQEEGF